MVDKTRLLFNIYERTREFTEDSAYLLTGYSDEHVYRVRDGRRYEGLRVLDVSAGVLAIGNTIVVIDPTQRGQKVVVVRVDREEVRLYEAPNENSDFRNLNISPTTTYLSIRSEQNGWYEVGYFGDGRWLPSDTGDRIELPVFSSAKPK